MRLHVRIPSWLVVVAWIGWPPIGRFVFHRWIHGSLLMRAGPGGQDTEFLVYSPLERSAFWLLIAVIPVALTLGWWYGRSRARRQHLRESHPDAA